MLQGIYAISDEILTPYQEIFTMLSKASKGGVSMFQFRDKTHQDNQIESLVTELMDYCKQEGVLFVLNDRIELAMKLQTKGLHIGKKQEVNPYSLDELLMIRKSYGGILGVSCYGDLQLAQNAKEIEADYIAFGSCFTSSTKTQAKVISLDLFQKIQGIKKCAIGGINQQNIHQLQNTDMAACISSIWKGDITQNILNLKRNWKKI